MFVGETSIGGRARQSMLTMRVPKAMSKVPPTGIIKRSTNELGQLQTHTDNSECKARRGEMKAECKRTVLAKWNLTSM